MTTVSLLMSNLMRCYFQTSNPSHCALLFLSFCLVKRYLQVHDSHFQHEDNSRVIHTKHKHKQQWREGRDAHFLAGNTVTILGVCQLRITILRFVVLCYLASKNTTSNLKKHFD